MKRICFFLLLLVTFAFAQQEDFIYYQNLVYLEDGSVCTDQPPEAGFIVYLNQNQSQILTHNAPRWKPQSDPNIDGKGVFGVELGNFSVEPQVGDTVTVIFTSNLRGQQGTLSEPIVSLPWYRFPLILDLQQQDIPAPPENIRLVSTETGENRLDWESEAGLTYTIYRRNLADTLSDGRQRMLYSRIAEKIATDYFIDSELETDARYGYIVFAVNAQGLMSMPSPDVFRFFQSIELTAEPGSRNVTLNWTAVNSEDVSGYNIYRWKPGTSPETPIAYAGPETTYTDSRLPTDSEWIYEVKGRISLAEEFGASNAVRVTTKARNDLTCTYANFKTAIVIYKNTNRGRISASQISDIRFMVEKARLFYWINSGMKLNMEIFWYEIDAYRSYADPGGLYYQETAKDLGDLGVVNTQYDVVFRITPAIDGYWSVGVPTLNIPGPVRATGFSHSHWPIGTGVRYPFFHDSANMGLTWIFVHEVQHALDALYNANGYPEFYHGDKPWEFPVACGEHFSFQAKMFRHFRAYEELLGEWGDLYETVDADGDRFPDDDPRVPLDEKRFNSRATQNDTDADGLDDAQEALNGIYRGSDPNHPDTDGDGILDGADKYPRYPVKTEIPEFTPTIDATIESGWTMLNDTTVYSQLGYAPELYLAYDADYFYLALRLPSFSTPEIFLDFDADGWWWSSGNTVLSINPVSPEFKSFRSWDAGAEVKNYALSHDGPGGMWDTDATYRSQFGRRVLDPAQVRVKTDYGIPVSTLEMAFPKTPYAGLNLNPGDKLALNIIYHRVNANQNQWATTFDLYDFAEFNLQNPTAAESQPQNTLPQRFTLKQNYPNPFNPVTRIEFNLPTRAFTDLSIFDTTGRLVKNLIHAERAAGSHGVTWDGTDQQGKLVANGVYFYRLKTERGYQQVKKMSLLK